MSNPRFWSFILPLRMITLYVLISKRITKKFRQWKSSNVHYTLWPHLTVSSEQGLISLHSTQKALAQIVAAVLFPHWELPSQSLGLAADRSAPESVIMLTTSFHRFQVWSLKAFHFLQRTNLVYVSAYQTAIYFLQGNVKTLVWYRGMKMCLPNKKLKKN